MGGEVESQVIPPSIRFIRWHPPVLNSWGCGFVARPSPLNVVSEQLHPAVLVCEGVNSCIRLFDFSWARLIGRSSPSSFGSIPYHSVQPNEIVGCVAGWQVLSAKPGFH